jgi:hypothetical protein
LTKGRRTPSFALAKDILLSYEESCPLIVDSGKRKTPGWNPDLEKMKKGLNKAFNRRHRERENYETIRRDYKKATREAKQGSWVILCESTKDVPETARIHKIPKILTLSVSNLVTKNTPSDHFRAQLLYMNLDNYHIIRIAIFQDCDPLPNPFVTQNGTIPYIFKRLRNKSLTLLPP